MATFQHILFHKKTFGLRTLLGLLILLAAMVLWAWPILPAKDFPGYFNFSDRRVLLGTPNAMDVWSNLFFLFFGLLSLRKVLMSRGYFSSMLFACGIILSVSAVLTCFGSIYFHWNPSKETLVWDRLPMTVGFSAIAAMMIADRIDETIAKWVLIFLVPFGIFSVIGYQQEWITLKPYIAVQFGSILFIILAVIMLKEKKMSNFLVWSTIGLYAVAKVFEMSDSIVFDFTGMISGHTLKHFFAGLAIYKISTLYNLESKT